MTVDLLCLVSDKNMEAAVEGLLSVPQRLGIRPITHQMVVHPEKDSGCFHSGPELLRGMQSRAGRALVMLDHEWDAPASTGQSLEERLRGRLAQVGLAGRAEAVVIEPELEAWVFAGSPNVAVALGWPPSSSKLQSALEKVGLWPGGHAKPPEPKKAMEWALRKSDLPRSSSVFRQLATTVGTKNCQDRAFIHFRQTLRDWFP